MILLYLLMMTACLVQTDDDLNRCTRRDSTRAAWHGERRVPVKRHGECTQYF